MSRRLIPVTIIVLAVLVTVAGLISNVIAGDKSLTDWLKLQPWYSLPNALLMPGAIVLIMIALQLWQQHSAKTDEQVPEGASPPISPSVRRDLLDKTETEWVHDRLHQGLRNAIRIDLKLTETLAAVRPMLRIHTIAESGQPDERQVHDDIANIFKKANGRLLILGEPGTGKTNLLLELAESLIATSPIPIVFSLPRWTLGARERSLADWMIDDLTDVAQYGLSRATANALLRQNRITPLLDGLDEVAEERRARCVEAIHAYQQERDLGKLAVCCRLVEYELLAKLNLRTAIRVEKLTQAEIERYISMGRLAHVRRALEGDPELWKVIDTPLWLHVAVLAAEVELPTGSQPILPRDRLYARFVEYALGRVPDGSPRKQTAATPLKHWLGWLAAEMMRRSQTQFSFEELDYSWLPTEWAARWLAKCIGGLVVGLVFGLNEILQPKAVSGRSSPNRGTFRSLRYALLLLSGLVLGTGGGAVALPRVLWPIPIAALCGAPLLALNKGGGFAIKHYVVRLSLWRNGLAPLRYVRFWNECADRLFLTRHLPRLYGQHLRLT